MEQRPLLILDEPMNHLDVDGRRRLRNSLQSFVATGDRAVLMVCHETPVADHEWRGVDILDLRGFA